jgi:hypothetical protein
MFTILRKNFGGRIHDRYFTSWESAKKEMLKDIEDCCKSLNGKVTKKWDYFNSSKGFYVFEQEALFEEDNKSCRWALVDGYFEDE